MVSAPAGDAGVTWLSVFVLTSAFVLLLAGFGLALRYHAFGEAQVGWLTTGLVAIAVPHIAVSIRTLVSGTSSPAYQVGATTHELLLVPIAVVVFWCLRTTKRDRSLRPVTTGLTLGVLIAIVNSGLDGQTLPRGLVTTVDGLLAVGLAGIAIVLVRGNLIRARARRWAVAVILQFAAVFAVTALAGAVSVRQLLGVSAVAGLAATVSMVLITMTLLWEVDEFNSARLSLWLQRADEAERAERRMEDTMHQVRSSVTTLSKIFALMCNLGGEDGAGQRRRLETMLEDEVSRVTTMVAEESVRETPSCRSTSLDAVIRLPPTPASSPALPSKRQVRRLLPYQLPRRSRRSWCCRKQPNPR